MRTAITTRFAILVALAVKVVTGFDGEASAAVIYDNGGPNGLTGWFSDSNSSAWAGDDFTLTQTVTLRDVHWWGWYGQSNTPTEPDNFRIQLFDISAGTPSQIDFYTANVGNVGRTDSGIDAGGADIYVYWTNVTEIVLNPGDYLISISNDTTADTDDNWVWASSATGTGNHKVKFTDPGPWNSRNDELAFQLTDDGMAIPEPGALFIFALGVAGLGLARHRKAAV